jgi:excisionase family DNA binding protein
MAKTPKTYYTTTEVAEQAGISRDTLLRWLKGEKIPEPGRDRNGWRAFTKTEVNGVIRYAKKYTPSPSKSQRALALGEKRR